MAVCNLKESCDGTHIETIFWFSLLLWYKLYFQFSKVDNWDVFPFLPEYINDSYFFCIFQLSSKCDNRLFHIKFSIPKIGTYPFLETISHSIHCISRNRNTRSSSLMCKRSSSVVHPLSGSQSSGLDDLSSDIQHSNLRELKPSPSLKRIKSGQEKSSATFMVDPTMDQPDEECNSHAWTSNQVIPIPCFFIFQK